jgi:xylan 1,4-beta-xylosidase
MAQQGRRPEERPQQTEQFLIKRQTVDPRDLVPGERTITIEADRAVGECYRFWSVANCNRPQFFLQPGFAERMRHKAPFVSEANLVYILGGRIRGQNEWYQGVNADGSVRADFGGLIAQLRAVVDAGYLPRPVLDNVPYGLSTNPSDNTYGNTEPPIDERLWHKYVEAAMRAMVEAFGRETVATWWFRVGTEPDLNPHHWTGTREQYFAHYDYTVDAVLRVVPEAKIGPGNILNPAEKEYRVVDWDMWGLDIIDHCATGRNYCTGGVGTPMRVFSWSWYGVVGVPITVYDVAAERVLSRLRRYPQFANVVLEIGEFAVLVDADGRRIFSGEASEWSASFYAALADRAHRYGIRQMYEWGQTTDGVLHPRAQVIAMLDRMAGGRRLAVDVAGRSAATCGCLASRQGDKLLLLVYNHCDVLRPHVAEKVTLTVRDGRMKRGGAWRISEWTIDEQHGTWIYEMETDLAAAGVERKPEAAQHEGGLGDAYGTWDIEAFQKNRAKYAAMAVTPQTRVDEHVTVADGSATMTFEMPGHSVRLIELSPVP